MTCSTDQPDGVEAKLRALMVRGFQFLHPRDADGELVAVIGIRAHHGVVDVVKLHSEDDTTAVRMPGTEEDVMAPTTVLWRTSGRAHDVLDEMLALDDPRSGDTLRTVDDAPNGHWVQGRPGRFRWLIAAG